MEAELWIVVIFDKEVCSNKRWHSGCFEYGSILFLHLGGGDIGVYSLWKFKNTSVKDIHRNCMKVSSLSVINAPKRYFYFLMQTFSLWSLKPYLQKYIKYKYLTIREMIIMHNPIVYSKWGKMTEKTHIKLKCILLN